MVYLQALASDAVDIWQLLCDSERDALGFHTSIPIHFSTFSSTNIFITGMCQWQPRGSCAFYKIAAMGGEVVHRWLEL